MFSHLCRLALVTVFVGGTMAADPPPNIVHIIADDMGYSDLGCYGGEIETPHLDGLAKGGIRFTNFYVNNMCWPTRAILMTGLYPKTALPENGSSEGGLHPEATTLPQALREAGYTTLMSGKWHLSSTKKPDGPNAPHHRGFDRFYGTINGASDFFAPNDVQLNGESMTHEWKGNGDYYYTDAIVDHALDFLKQRKQNQPFYLYLSFTAAHWPLHAKPEDIRHYKGRYAEGWDVLREKRHARMKELGVVPSEWELSPRHPEVPAWEGIDRKRWQQRRMEVYAAQITSMDRNIGRVIDYLKASGIFDDTLILYHHDNGGCHVEYGKNRTGSWTREFTTDGTKTPVVPGNIPGLMPGPQSTFQSYGYGWANASNTPFRLFKQHDHEGGTRSPLILSWPGGLPTKSRGSLSPILAHAIDVMPSLLAVAGVPAVDQRPLPMEGSDLSSAIARGEAPPRRTPLFWEHGKGRAVRDGDLKLVATGKGDWEFYDLSEDGTELNDLSKERPKAVERLVSLFEEWKQRTDLSATQPQN